MVFRWCLFVRVGTEPFSRRENLTSRYSCSGSPDHNRIKRNGRFEHSQLKQEGVYANELHIDRYPEIDTLYLSQLTQVASNFAQRWVWVQSILSWIRWHLIILSPTSNPQEQVAVRRCGTVCRRSHCRPADLVVEGTGNGCPTSRKCSSVGQDPIVPPQWPIPAVRPTPPNCSPDNRPSRWCRRRGRAWRCRPRSSAPRRTTTTIGGPILASPTATRPTTKPGSKLL